MAKKPTPAKLKIAAAIASDMQDAYHEFHGEDETNWNGLKDERKMEIVATIEELLKDPTPENAHKLWMEDRLSKGWKLDEKFDADSRTSPYLVDYEELEDDIKWKDWLWVHSITSYLARA